MQKKFTTVMAVLDDNAQELLHSIQHDLEQQYGADTKTKDIPFHITLGSYAVEDTEEIVARIKEVAKNYLNYISILIQIMQMAIQGGFHMQRYIDIASQGR